MSVKNLRNKFSQNNGTVPYNPPGLSYGTPALGGNTTITNNNNNNSHNNSNNNHVTSNGYQQKGIGTRFKTIREEPDAVEEKLPTKNNSFLQNYLSNGKTSSGVSPAHVSKFVPRSTPSVFAPVPTVKSPQPAVVKSPPLPAKSLPTTVKSPPPAVKSPNPPSHSVADTASKYNDKPKSVPLTPTMAAYHPPKFVSVKSPVPLVQSATATDSSSSPPSVVSKYAMKSPPPVPENAPPPKLPAKSSLVLTNGLVSPNGGADEKWRTKYDDAEAKRKTLLTQSQKLLREKSDMERQLAKMHKDLDVSNKELSEKTLQLSQLRKLSEAMYKEYDQLKQQYELETGTLHKAMERASQWYKQNRELKRRSSALMQKVMSVAPSELDDMTDDTDGNDDTEMEELRKTVKELTQEVSRLQAELNKIKLQEFEAQEQTVDLTSELEEERRERKRVEQELKELKMKHDNLENVSRKVVEETTVLHQRYKKEKEEGEKIRSDANKVKSERDVLARQSQLLMMDAVSDERIMALLFEVEQLQRSLSQERQEYSEHLKDLQDKLESQSESEQIELYEEKLKLTEAELLCSQQRAEIAESQVEELRKKLEEAKTVVAAPSCAPPPPPPPPPPMSMPPPPPPPPMAFAQNMQSIKLKTVSTLNSTNDNSNPIEEMGNYLGLPLANPKGPQVQNGAIDAIINQIKGGRFSLKPAEKEVPVKKQEAPAVVNEMMNVLGTLRRNPKRRASFKSAPADVAL